MFSNLDLLLNKENYDENKTVYLYLKDEVREYEVVSVYYCPLILDEEGKYTYVSEGYEYYNTSYSDDEFDVYKNTISNNQLYYIDSHFSNYDKYLTLQTCVNAIPDLKEIVLCKEINTDAYN